MFGFVIGTLSLIGLIGLIGGHHVHRYHGGHGWHGHDRGWHNGGRGGSRSGGRWRDGVGRAAGEMLKRRLRIDDDQEPIVDLALADVRSALGELWTTLRETRSDLAGAVRGEAVDEGAIDAAFNRHDEALVQARRQIVSAIKQIHAVLEPEQRDAAAEWLATAGPRWV